MTDDNREKPSSEAISELWMSEAELEEIMAADRLLIERGLKAHEKWAAAFDAEERARDAAMAAGREVVSDGQPMEAEVDKFNDWQLMGIALQKQAVLDAFGLDPRKSALFEEFPQLLARACDPQCPVLYEPSERQFSLMETWGPAVLVIAHCPWSGKPLPKRLDEEWNEAVTAALGTDDWSYDDARAKLPREFWTEAWWVDRGL